MDKLLQHDCIRKYSDKINFISLRLISLCYLATKNVKVSTILLKAKDRKQTMKINRKRPYMQFINCKNFTLPADNKAVN